MIDSYYGSYRNLRFDECWNTADEFVEEYKDSGLAPANNKITDASAETLFWLLFSEYGASVIGSSNVDQFKYQIFATIFEYGPTWEKRINLQNSIRSLTDEDLTSGTLTILNHAYNPSTTPGTTTTTELNYINEQNTQRNKKSKLDAYNTLAMLLDTDVTREFITKFKKLFLQIVQPELPLWYVTKDGNTSEGDEEE